MWLRRVHESYLRGSPLTTPNPGSTPEGEGFQVDGWAEAAADPTAKPGSGCSSPLWGDSLTGCLSRLAAVTSVPRRRNRPFRSRPLGHLRSATPASGSCCDPLRLAGSPVVSPALPANKDNVVAATTDSKSIRQEIWISSRHSTHETRVVNRPAQPEAPAIPPHRTAPQPPAYTAHTSHQARSTESPNRPATHACTATRTEDTCTGTDHLRPTEK